MKKAVLAIMVSLLWLGSISAQETFRILFLNPAPVAVDGRDLNVGSRFQEGVELQWQSDNQVMKIVNEKSSRQFVLTSKTIPDSRKGKLSDYLNVSNQLSTRSAAYADDVKQGSMHYVGYTDRDGSHTFVPERGMFMDELPKELWLCYFDARTSKSRVETRDFRALVDDLIITDHLVRRLMIGMDDSDETYLALISQFISKEFRDIPLTVKEIEIYVSLKY